MTFFNFQNPSGSPGTDGVNDDESIYKLEEKVPSFDSITGWQGNRPIDSDDIFSDYKKDQATVSHGSDFQTTLESEPKIEEAPTAHTGVGAGFHSSGVMREIDVAKIFPNPFQPRKVFDPTALQELADSIKEHGVIQPVVVTETAAGFELVVGERRFRASVLAGLTRVPAIVKEGMADLTKLEVALIENIQRHELNPIEEAHAYDRLVKGFAMTQEQIAKKLGKSRPAITNTLRLLNLPAEIQRAIVENKLAEGHARPLLSITDRNQQMALFREILEKGLNTRQIEARSREIVQRKSVDGLAPDPKILAFESELRGRVGAPVKIQRLGGGGKITIEFYSEAELEDIIRRVADEKVVNQESREYLTV